MGNREPWGTGSAGASGSAESARGGPSLTAHAAIATACVASVATGAAAVVAPDVLAGLDASPVQAAGLATVLVVGGRGRSLGGLVGSIGAGALALGALAWLIASQTGILEANVTLAAGLGLAVGGGFGSVAWLLAVGEDDGGSTEEMTVDMEEADGPRPTPVDLFDACPDPILFFAEDADGPVVLAANRAFEDAFGVSGSALEGTPLADGVLTTEGATDLVAAARRGESFDRVLTCETEDGQEELRLRLAVTDDPADSGGYVLYTPTATR